MEPYFVKFGDVRVATDGERYQVSVYDFADGDYDLYADAMRIAGPVCVNVDTFFYWPNQWVCMDSLTEFGLVRVVQGIDRRDIKIWADRFYGAIDNGLLNPRNIIEPFPRAAEIERRHLIDELKVVNGRDSDIDVTPNNHWSQAAWTQYKKKST